MVESGNGSWRSEHKQVLPLVSSVTRALGPSSRTPRGSNGEIAQAICRRAASSRRSTADKIEVESVGPCFHFDSQARATWIGIVAWSDRTTAWCISLNLRWNQLRGCNRNQVGTWKDTVAGACRNRILTIFVEQADCRSARSLLGIVEDRAAHISATAQWLTIECHDAGYAGQLASATRAT